MKIDRVHQVLGLRELPAAASFAPQRHLLPERPALQPPLQVGSLPPALPEASGVVTSLRYPEIMWMHNDSDRSPVLFAVRPSGELVESIAIENASHYDWEDITRVQLDGESILAVCDVGDNYGKRDTCVIHLIREPDPTERTAKPLASIRFRYEDGPRDVEAVAADGDRLLLLSKRDQPPVLYELPLSGDDLQQTRVARRLGVVTSIPEAPLPPRLPPPDAGAVIADAWKTQPTAMDIDPDGRRLALVTYSQLCLYERRANESWFEALQRQPTMLPLPVSQRQAEAVGFSPDGRAVYVTSEGKQAPIHRVEITPAG